jgi:type I restriction enzyme S subunit
MAEGRTVAMREVPAEKNPRPRYKPYPKYKDSGVAWLGEIPEHWESARVKSITAEHKQGFYTEQAYLDEGVRLARITDIDDHATVSFEDMPFVQIGTTEERVFRIVEGDFLFARSGTIGRFGVVRKAERVVFASYLIRFRSRE